MPIIYNEEDGRTDDTDAGISLTSTMLHPSGYFEYLLTTLDNTFSISAESHAIWNGPADLRVPPSKRMVHINSFKKIMQSKDGNALSNEKEHIDYNPYRSVIVSLLKVKYTSGDPDSTIEVVVDFSNIDKHQKKREAL